MVSVNVNVPWVFSADWISRNGYSRQIIFIDVGTTFWVKPKSTDVENLLAAFSDSELQRVKERRSPGGVIFDRASIKHEDKAVCVHPTQEDIDPIHAAAKKNLSKYGGDWLLPTFTGLTR